MQHDDAVDPAMTVADLGEFGLIARLGRIAMGASADPLRPAATGDLGIGDDAALWQPTAACREVLTTDALIEDVHFRLSTTSWHDLGWKALAESVSDIAAMGARPTRAFVTLGLHRETRVADLDDLYRGMAELVAALSSDGMRVEIAGGDTVSAPQTILSVTVLGDLSGEGLRRAAGRAGDVLAVTGTLGGSAGGLALLEAMRERGGAAPSSPGGPPRSPTAAPLSREHERGGPASHPAPGGETRGSSDRDEADRAALVKLHRRPWPRVAEGLVLVEAGVRCGMDLSDGLRGDAGKLAYASGLAAVIDVEALPMAPVLARQFGETAARAMALAGGEDYELLVAAASATIERASRLLSERGLAPLTVVGRLAAGTPGTAIVVDDGGRPYTEVGTSWDHFARSAGGDP